MVDGAVRRGIAHLIRPDLREHVEYEPIEPVEVLGERGQTGARNAAAEALAQLGASALPELGALLRHPDPDQRRLRAALADYVGVPEDHIVAGSGSDELIDLIARALLSPGDAVIDLTPTFGMYAFTASVCGGRTVSVARRPDFSVDVEAVARAVDERTKIIFAASPNNPSGNRLSRRELDALLELSVLVVLDEAYVEFSGGSHAGLVPERENLVVLRTFSKWAGLAGVRAGYGIMPPELAQALMAIKPPYNVNVPAEVAVLASLDDREALQANVRRIVEERERLLGLLRRVPYLEPWASEANFILCRVTRGSARDLRDRLRERGIFLRYFGRPGLEDCIRVSVGRPEHTDALLAALAEVAP